MCAGCERRARALPGSPDSRRLGREAAAAPGHLALPRRVGPRGSVMSRDFTGGPGVVTRQEGKVVAGPGPQDQVCGSGVAPALGCTSAQKLEVSGPRALE